ncbi:MAG: phosphoadenylyl-sulfate reductase [Pseudomonadota bacterium]|uniref:phosphoadenylyl-sulfate reductase n=1 Tax=Roseovarius TaxID=74030 RepID=UPI0022A8192C|nr:phosphoadenylyl-sulfate reductase [Roseovarius sp. EGI FJ00037]MCZ0812286.1 phosphoadenylyl-sulfate reductase [Roseovarius sp. EGI FJ00037]
MQPRDPAARVAALNARYKDYAACDVLHHALRDPDLGKLALVSSFGAESAVLLHMVEKTQRNLPMIFIDTDLLFDETLAYQQELTELLDLQDLRIIRPDAAALEARDPDESLWQTAPDACCALRKTEPLQRALSGFDGWITGRKRYQGDTRSNLDFFEAEPETGRIKVNPLVHWTLGDTEAYIEENNLPRHPLVAHGYPSIGCTPCTSSVKTGEDVRAGRWRGKEKSECGIHIVNGKITRKGDST